jgi:hypothetical protein
MKRTILFSALLLVACVPYEYEVDNSVSDNSSVTSVYEYVVNEYITETSEINITEIAVTEVTEITQTVNNDNDETLFERIANLSSI